MWNSKVGIEIRWLLKLCVISNCRVNSKKCTDGKEELLNVTFLPSPFPKLYEFRTVVIVPILHREVMRKQFLNIACSFIYTDV